MATRRAQQSAGTPTQYQPAGPPQPQQQPSMFAGPSVFGTSMAQAPSIMPRSPAPTGTTAPAPTGLNEDPGAPPPRATNILGGIGSALKGAVQPGLDRVKQLGQAGAQTAGRLGKTVTEGVQGAAERLQGGATETPPPVTPEQSWGGAWDKLKGGDLGGAWGALPGLGKGLLGGGGIALLLLLLSKLFGKRGDTSYSPDEIDEAHDLLDRLSERQKMALWGEACAQPDEIEKMACNLAKRYSRTKKVTKKSEVKPTLKAPRHSRTHKVTEESRRKGQFKPGNTFQGAKLAAAEGDVRSGGEPCDLKKHLIGPHKRPKPPGRGLGRKLKAQQAKAMGIGEEGEEKEGTWVTRNGKRVHIKHKKKKRKKTAADGLDWLKQLGLGAGGLVSPLAKPFIDRLQGSAQGPAPGQGIAQSGIGQPEGLGGLGAALGAGSLGAGRMAARGAALPPAAAAGAAGAGAAAEPASELLKQNGALDLYKMAQPGATAALARPGLGASVGLPALAGGFLGYRGAPTDAASKLEGASRGYIRGGATGLGALLGGGAGGLATSAGGGNELAVLLASLLGAGAGGLGGYGLSGTLLGKPSWRQQEDAAQELGPELAAKSASAFGAKMARDMPSFTEQDRPAKTKEIYRALKRDHPGMPAAVKARIASRQGKPGKQHQGPPYKAPLSAPKKS